MNPSEALGDTLVSLLSLFPHSFESLACCLPLNEDRDGQYCQEVKRDSYGFPLQLFSHVRSFSIVYKSFFAILVTYKIFTKHAAACYKNEKAWPKTAFLALVMLFFTCVFIQDRPFIPYATLSCIDLLSSPRLKSFTMGTTNALFATKKNSFDVVITVRDFWDCLNLSWCLNQNFEVN